MIVRPDVCWSTVLPDIAPSGWPTAIDAHAADDLARIAAHVPHRGTEAFIAEARLDGADPQIDVSLRLSATPDTHWVQTAAVPAMLAPAHPAWLVVRALLSPERPAPLAAAARHECWIEFDRAPSAQQSPPSVFITLRRDRVVSPREMLTALDVLELPVPLGTRRTLVRLCALLPARAQVAQLGLMLARGADAPLRVCLTGLTDEDLSRLWRRLGPAAADPSRVRRALHDVDAPTPDYVDLDLWDGVGERVGLEFRCDRRAQATGQLRELQWFEARHQEGLVSERWLQALRIWPGARRVRFAHQLWPSLTERTLNHCKLVVQHGEPVGLKGYCMLRHQDAPSRRTVRGVHHLPTGESYDRTTAVA